MEIIEAPSTIKKASERIVKVADDTGEVDAIYSVTFDVRMDRSDYLAVHQALINREQVLLTMDSDSDSALADGLEIA